VILWVGICSIALSFWCLWGPPPQASFSDVLLDAIKKGIVAVAMSVIIVMMAASKDDKENALRAVVSAAKRSGSEGRGESDLMRLDQRLRALTVKPLSWLLK